jgi:26S proteasome regulatory subunit N7
VLTRFVCPFADLSACYENICSELGISIDEPKLSAMKEKNAEKLKELEAKHKDAEDNLGETEVRDALLAKADYLAKIGDKQAAVAAYKETEEKTTGSGNKVDLVFSQIRCACQIRLF